MKNMKKILSALTALSFVTVAGVSTVACGPTNTPPASDMNAKVLADLGLYTEEGASNLEATLSADAKWDVALLQNVDASHLLDGDFKAKSTEAGDFLTKTLKLAANEEGVFEQDKAKEIILVIGEIKPSLVKIDDDYAIKEGTVSIKWMNGETEFSKQSLQLKGNPEAGIVANMLPALALTDFNTAEGVLAEFRIGGDVTKVTEGTSVKEVLNVENGAGKALTDLATLLDKEMKLTITSVTAADEHTFAEGDSITIKVNFGTGDDEVQFDTGYTFTLEGSGN